MDNISRDMPTDTSTDTSGPNHLTEEMDKLFSIAFE